MNGALGIFDASNADDGTGRVWRAYSIVGVSPTYGWGAISTCLAVSNDHGATFQDVPGVLNPAADLPDGFAVNHEVPTLTLDPSAPAAERWKLVWMVCVNNAAAAGDGWKRYDQTFTHFAMRSAPDPSGPWTEPVRLLGGAWLNPDPAVGGPARFTDPTALVVSEPACLPDQSGFWLAYQAMTAAATSEIRLAKFTANARDMTPCGAFLTAKDLSLLRLFYPAAFGSCAYFAAPFLFSRGGKTWLGVTPADASHAYKGTAIFQVQDTARARLVKSMGLFPKLVKFIAPVQPHSGAGCYSGDSTASGIVVSEFSVNQAPMFQLRATGVQVS